MRYEIERDMRYMRLKKEKVVSVRYEIKKIVVSKRLAVSM